MSLRPETSGRGAAALFALGIGMGLPLLAFGTFGAGILPKSGPWLAHVKQVFGFVFIGLAIWMISRVLSLESAVTLWGAGFAGAGVYLVARKIRARGRGQSVRAWPAAAGVLSLGLGVFLITASGRPGLLEQFAGLPAFASVATNNAAEFETVTTSQALDSAMARARQQGKAVVLDFSAEWCVECKVMDRTVFSDAAVLRRLRDFVLIRADATNYNDETRSLMKRFDVVGPPTVVFLGAQDGKEAAQARIVGPVDASTFLKRLDRI